MAQGGMSGGEMANVLGTSLLGYWAGKKAEQRQGEIAGTSAQLADPFARHRPYYQGILGELYGMPEGYTDVPPESDEPTNSLEKLIQQSAGLFGGGMAGGGLLGGLLGGGGGAATGGLLGGLLG